jgi:putative membrane protein
MREDAREAEGASDPRVFFAAERTLLAWVRTGLTVVGLGFVVARFGLFLRLVAGQAAPAATPSSSAIIGVAFVLLGSLGIALATAQFARFVRALPSEDRPHGHWVHGSVWFAALLAASALLLAAYLMV